MKKLLISALALFVVGSVAAQEGLGETYNKAVAAYNSKDFASAATAFETLIDQGLDSEDLDVQSWVATAKKSVPVCYFQMVPEAIVFKVIDNRTVGGGRESYQVGQ